MTLFTSVEQGRSTGELRHTAGTNGDAVDTRSSNSTINTTTGDWWCSKISHFGRSLQRSPVKLNYYNSLHSPMVACTCSSAPWFVPQAFFFKSVLRSSAIQFYMKSDYGLQLQILAPRERLLLRRQPKPNRTHQNIFKNDSKTSRLYISAEDQSGGIVTALFGRKRFKWMTLCCPLLSVLQLDIQTCTLT